MRRSIIVWVCYTNIKRRTICEWFSSTLIPPAPLYLRQSPSQASRKLRSPCRRPLAPDSSARKQHDPMHRHFWRSAPNPQSIRSPLYKALPGRDRMRCEVHMQCDRRPSILSMIPFNPTALADCLLLEHGLQTAWLKIHPNVIVLGAGPRRHVHHNREPTGCCRPQIVI